MKKKIISLFLVLTLVLSGCGGSGKEEGKASEEKKDGKPKVTMVVNGNLGDRAFFDSAKSGADKLKAEKDIDVQIIETGADTKKWEPALEDAAESDADIIVAITFSMGEYVEKIAPMYPEKKFILIDATIDFDSGEDFSNVYTATFKQNEGSYLSGVLAGLLTEANIENINEENIVGFVGGMDVPVINDFLVGYIQGVTDVNPEGKVSVMYPNDYYNPAKGKEYGQVLIDQKCDVIFAAAGETGLGTIEAAKNAKTYIIGVDSDQSAHFTESGDTESANIIVTSLLKNVGETLYRAIDLHLKSELNWGANENLGIKENGMALVKNDVYKNTVPQEIQDKIEEVEEKIIKGEIEVDTAIGKGTAELDEIRNRVKP